MNIKLHIGIIAILWMMVFVMSIFIEPKPSASEKEKQEVHWSYEGETGPAHWGELDPAFVACQNGENQSPINIDQAKASPKQAAGLDLDYHPTKLNVINNGHTIEATPQQRNQKLTINGFTFSLDQIHFHSPSEHQIDGKHYPMEIHLVHKNNDEKLAVLGVMIKEGKENVAATAILDKTVAKVNILNLIPENRGTYQYIGSLTTPPCTEGVNWFLFKEPIEMSKEQIKKFAEIFPANNRPIQPVQKQKVIFAK